MMARPLKYETPEDVEAVIDDYFKATPKDNYTVTGLALAFGSKQLLSDYEKREGFTHIIQRARLRVEHKYELGLMGKSPVGAIFALKNMGWIDKTEQIIRVGVNAITDEYE